MSSVCWHTANSVPAAKESILTSDANFPAGRV